MVAKKRRKSPVKNNIPQLLENARQHYQCQRLSDAQDCCEKVVQQQPDHIEALHLLGLIAAHRGDWERAIAHYRLALRIQPQVPEIHYNLANTLKAVEQIEEAIAHYNRAIALRPNYLNAHYNLGNLLFERGQIETAIAHYDRACTLDPNDPEIHTNLGNAYKEAGNLQAAIARYQQAIALRPQDANAYYNLAIALHESGQLEEALSHYDRAIGLDPDLLSARWNRALTLLLAGDYRRGFVEYEHRWQLRDRQLRSFSQPLWEGSDLAGRTILLHAEQGLGDTIQFIRYAAIVAQRGGRVIVECDRTLLPVLQSVPGIDRLVARDSALPDFDVHAPLMSLPRILGTTLETIPVAIPYIQKGESKPILSVPFPSSQLNIGIVWAANFKNSTALKRSCPLHFFLELLEIPGVNLYGLQKEITECDRDVWKKAIAIYGQDRLQDLSSDLHDFGDTAAMIEKLDLIISVDTAVAHLAGAMGKAVWCLLSFAPDWRWLLDRADSPWYPTMRLFRQSQVGDWQSVFDAVKAELVQNPRSQTLEKYNSEETLEIAIQHHQAGRLIEAVELYGQVLENQPDSAIALNNLGMALKEQGKLAAAIACYQKAVSYAPNEVALHYNLGNALWEDGQLAAAIAQYREVIAQESNHIDAYNNLGMVLQEQGNLKEAIANLNHAIALDPERVKTHNNLGLALQEYGKVEEAIACYEAALGLQSDYPEAHNNLGVALLLNAEFRRGFNEYEWRWRVKAAPQLPAFEVPLWDGSDLQGKTILLYAEQGLGDTIQFIRYASSIAKRGGRAIAQVPEPLVSLLQTVPGLDRAIASHLPLPDFDVWAPLMSLPRILGTTLETIPADIPYINCVKSKPITPHSDGKLKVGIVWAGNPKHPSDRTRSCSITPFLKLLEIPEITLYSLQKGGEEFRIKNEKLPIQDLAPELHDFADTAAIVSELDLVITVDTSIAHLAGALGKPVWVLLSYAPDWRWMRDREDTPWYRTMRLFRQRKLGDWSEVFDRVFEALREEVNRQNLEVKKITEIESSTQQIELARERYEAGNHREAEQLCGEILQVQPHEAQALQILGTIAHKEGKLEAAIAYYKQAIAADPQAISAYINLGAALRKLGQTTEAIAYLNQLIRMAPNCIPGHYNLGNSLYDEGRIEESIAEYRKVIELDPKNAKAYYNLGNTLRERGDRTEAISHLNRAIALDPNDPEAYNNLGNTLLEVGQIEAAIAQFQRALTLNPNYVEALVNLGNALQEKHNTTEAIATYHAALQLQPDFPDARINLAMSLLISGDLRRGFAEYEWRWRVKGCPPLPGFNIPLWDGSNLEGKTILLHAEQGLGDTLQFIRYAASIAKRGGRAIARVAPTLVELLQTVEAIDEVLAIGSPLPHFDAYAPLMSLPRILGTTLETIPADIPYINPVKVKPIPNVSFSHKLKVGIVWAGNPKYSTDRKRSCGLTYFKKLLDIPEIAFYSLQKGAEELTLKTESLNIEDLAPQLDNFADTAAAISQLDLVITVDTSVAHLAGAMGKSVWVVLCYAPDWRWLLDTDKTPWYPTMQLFRQPQLGDWDAVFDRVAEALREEVKKRGNQVTDRESIETEIAQFREIIARQPHLAEAHYNLANLLKKQERIEEAIAYYQQAIAEKPNYVKAYYNLGNTLLESNKIEEAIAQYERVLSVQPDDADAHTNLGFALLANGDFKRGFAEYEWRRKRSNERSRHFSQPLWDGSDLSGQTILLHTELGFGDSIQFIRYAAIVAQRGGRVILESPPPLMRLFQSVSGIDRVIPTGEPLPDFDVHAPLMSLPWILGTTLETIPADIPYIDRMESKPIVPIENPIPLLKIGIVWAGSPRYGNQRDRSCKLEHFLKLADLPEIALYSLQKGEREADLTALAQSDRICLNPDANPRFDRPTVRDLSPQIADFADTAVAIAQLDLVMTVDTSVAHLAGALGKPVWVLLPFAPDWRWMRDREDNPWYPTMRLFRQNQPGNWEGMFDRVRSALSEKLATSEIQSTESQNSTLAMRDRTPNPPSPKPPNPELISASKVHAQNPLRIGITWPLNLMTGWGIYGLNLTLQLQQNCQFQPMLLMPPDTAGLVNPLQRSLLQPVLNRYQQLQELLAKNPGKPLWCDFPVLHALGNDFVSVATRQQIGGKHNLGVIFFEDTNLNAEKRDRAKKYEMIIAGSTWNAEVLKSNGIENVRAIPQGIDPTLFHPAPKSNLFGDRFVIFTGGKLEYRKGQDIIVAAFKAFHQRHPDALLLTAWHNFWPQFMAGMERTGNVVGLPQMSGDRRLQIGEWLVANGLTSDSFIDVGAIPNHIVGQILREADVAVFTNRCEGGTNLVAMESMACGIPTILSANTGHLDLIDLDRCYPLQHQRSVQPTPQFAGVEGWGESDVEEVVETLERIYQNREEAKNRGRAAAIFMQNWTWENQVRRFLQVLDEVLPSGGFS